MSPGGYEPIQMDQSENSEQFKHLPNDKALGYLGISTTISGNTVSSYDAINDIVNTFCSNMRKSYIPAAYAQIAAKTILLPKLLYQLSCYYIKEPRINKIQTRHDNVIIPKMSFNRHWPKELRYGSHPLCGLQVTNILLDQTIQQITMLERCIRNKHTINIILNVIDMYHIQTGLVEDPLHYHEISNILMDHG